MLARNVADQQCSVNSVNARFQSYVLQIQSPVITGEAVVNETTASSSAGKISAASTIGRQAIVLVHGMGEQVPMDTIRDFAEAVWSEDKSLHDKAADGTDPGELFFVPDPNSGSRELRRVSTRKSRPR